MGGKASQTAKKRYDRIASLYDLTEAVIERLRYSRWRELLWSKVEGSKVLEVGVGTGKNFPYYPPNVEITAIDFSPKMLRRAQIKAEKQGLTVNLQLMDVENLLFKDDTFDTVVASFVFCSVPDPVRGLAQVHRVCKPGGKVALLEHVRSANAILGWLMDVANPFVVRMIGANINRDTVENVRGAGLEIKEVTELWGGIFKLVEAGKRPSS